MIHLKKWGIFESKNTADNKKYEMVVFNKNYTFENIFAGEDKLLNISFKKGDRAKVFFDIEATNEDLLVIKGIRPMETTKNEKVDILKYDAMQLWEANFIFNSTLTIKRSESPFTVEQYI